MLVAGSLMPIALLDLVRQITGMCLLCLGCYHARLAKLFVDGSSLRSFSFTVSFSLKVLPNPQPGVSFFISSQKYMKSGELKWITEWMLFESRFPHTQDKAAATHHSAKESLPNNRALRNRRAMSRMKAAQGTVNRITT